MPPAREWMWGKEAAAGGASSSDEDDERASLGSGESRASRTSSSSSWSSSESASAYGNRDVEVVQTSFGPATVTVCGNRSKASLITYHDVALNHATCFQGLFECAEPSSVLMSNFCVYHIDAPGHEANAAEISLGEPELSMADLSEQVAEVIQHFGLKQVVCMGVTAGAYVLTQLAINHPSLVEGLILISPVVQAASWSEWALSKLTINMLCFYGMTSSIKEGLLARFFSTGQHGYQGPGSDSLLTFFKELETREPWNIARYMQAYLGRADLSEKLQDVKCPTLIVAGEHSPFREASLEMYARMDPSITTWIQVDASSSLITEERPHMLQTPIMNFLCKLGYFRRPRSCLDLHSHLTLSPSPSFSAEDFSPKACGVNLKPIRTRVRKMGEDMFE